MAGVDQKIQKDRVQRTSHMIFVISGTERFPFDRMIREIDNIRGHNKIDESVFIQLGTSTYKPEYCSWTPFLPFDEMCNKIAKSELIIAHAGAGTTLLCLQYGKKPILVPRRKKYKEHVDDHQVIFAEKMSNLGLAEVVFDLRQLLGMIHNAKKRNDDSVPRKVSTSELDLYLSGLF